MKQSILKMFILLFTVLSFVNCSNEDEMSKLITSENELQKKTTNNKEDFSKLASALINNLTEMTYSPEKAIKNYPAFTKTVAGKEDLSVKEISGLLASNFEIPEESSMDFFQIAYDYRELLLQEDAKKLLLNELELQLKDIKLDDNQKRGFGFLASFFGAPCYLVVLGHIADAMIGTAVAAVTAPTGAGAVIAGTRVAMSVAQAVTTASDC